MEENIMKVNLKVWRQAGPKAKGGFVTYEGVETTPDTIPSKPLPNPILSK